MASVRPWENQICPRCGMKPMNATDQRTMRQKVYRTLRCPRCGHVEVSVEMRRTHDGRLGH